MTETQTQIMTATPYGSCKYIANIIVAAALWVGYNTATFSCVSYEATKSLSRWQRVYSVGLRWPPL